MRIAFLSDIHANRQALDACLAHAARQHVDHYVFLGDLIGYGGDPSYVIDRVALLASEGAVVLLGNHDAAVIGATGRMNDYARAAALWTSRQLNEAQLAFIGRLPLTVTEEDRLYVHSEAVSPPSWNYITTATEAQDSLRTTTQRLTFCGHVHRPQLYHMSPQKPAVLFVPPAGEPIPLMGHRKWLAMMGSVGQPRDENPAAAYAILDTKANELTYLRVPYDIQSAAAAIHAAGLPRVLAARLFIGR
jgi:diadenosine tetraphosphatase ApaH/serine/threonine PP2A family protein phosphatase